MSSPKRAAPAANMNSGTLQALYAVWEVLRRFASRQKPLSAEEICDYLKEIKDAPSPAVAKRLFPREKELMERLFPGTVTPAGEAVATGAYFDDGTLHIVLETPQGDVLQEDGMALEAAVQPFALPSRETVARILENGVPFGLDTFPYRLRCVAKSPCGNGRFRVIPYEKWEKAKEEGGAERPRLYYLSDALTDAEHGALTEMVRVYPFITEAQSKKLLALLDRLHPTDKSRLPSRYAAKRDGQDLLRTLKVLDDAIRDRKKLMIEYGDYQLQRVAGQWRPVLARQRGGVLELEPYALMWADGSYQLIGQSRDVMQLRVDHILSAKRLEGGFDVPDTFNADEYRGSGAATDAGERARVRLCCKLSLLGDLLGAFGSDAEYNAPRADGTVDVTLSVVPAAAKRFALLHAADAEVIEPARLREEIAKELKEAVGKYK